MAGKQFCFINGTSTNIILIHNRTLEGSNLINIISGYMECKVLF